MEREFDRFGSGEATEEGWLPSIFSSLRSALSFRLLHYQLQYSRRSNASERF